MRACVNRGRNSTCHYNGNNIVMTEIESDHIVKTLLFKKENIWDMIDIIGWNKIGIKRNKMYLLLV